MRIELGARSALDPHADKTIRPYVEVEAKRDLGVPNVRTVLPERTFWDKVIILHALRRSFDVTGKLKNDGQRVSRHYFDVDSLLRAPDAKHWENDDTLALDCAQHAQMFFGSASSMLDQAKPGSYTLSPTPDMAKVLATDYDRMTGMVFGDVPRFEAVLAAIRQLERRLNG